MPPAKGYEAQLVTLRAKQIVMRAAGRTGNGMTAWRGFAFCLALADLVAPSIAD